MFNQLGLLFLSTHYLRQTIILSPKSEDIEEIQFHTLFLPADGYRYFTSPVSAGSYGYHCY